MISYYPFSINLVVLSSINRFQNKIDKMDEHFGKQAIFGIFFQRFNSHS